MKNKLNIRIIIIVIIASLVVYAIYFAFLIVYYGKLFSEFSGFFWGGFISLLVLVLVLSFILNGITKPISRVVRILKSLEKGDIEEIDELKISSRDELSEMLQTTNNLVLGLNSLANFASEVGKGNYTAKYNKLSDKDKLGSLLVEMRDSLAKAEKKNQISKFSAERRNWINNGLAIFGELLRGDSSDINAFSYQIISRLVKYLNANQGAVLLLNDENKNDVFLDLISTYAFERRKFAQKKIHLGESLTGQCVLEKEIIYLTELPEDYTTITSGLGKATPRNLIIVPLIFNETVQGVIEIASFNIFDNYERQFIEKVSEAIAATFSTLKINNQTAKLLKDSDFQAEHMSAQEEQMRQNMEQIRAVQEDAERKMENYENTIKKLEKQIELLEDSNK